MVKIYSFISINMLNNSSPYWFCILLFSRLDPNPHNESMCDFFNGFHSEPMFFSFLYPESWYERILIQQKVLLLDNSTIHGGSHFFINSLSKKSQIVHHFLRNVSSFQFLNFSFDCHSECLAINW